VDRRWVQDRTDGLVERKPTSAHEDGERREQRPKEAFPSVAERVRLVGGTGTAEHPDEQEDVNPDPSRVRYSLRLQGNRAGHADRQQPGHWEGDLIMGRANRSAIGTLVERTTRTVALVHLPTGHNGKQMKDALAKQLSAFPAHLARSLTWDQGSEMGCHHELTAGTGIAVYFCDPASPWQMPMAEELEREHERLATPVIPQGHRLKRA
jgi:hypothetical protein